MSASAPSTSAPAADVDAPFTELSGKAWSLLIVLCGAIFLDALDVSMMGVALPAIRDDLGMSTSGLQWVMSAYVLGYGGFLLLGGRAADLLGRRRMFLISLTVFVVFSGLGGLATGGELLIAARFVTGVSAAFTAPAGLSIIATSFAEGPARTKALSVFGATGASGFGFGLVVGGALTEVNWRWVFFVPVVMSALILAGASRLLPRTARPPVDRRGFDIAGSIVGTAAMLLLVYTLVEAPERGWGTTRTIGGFVAVAVLFAAFTSIERRVAVPLLRLGMLRSATVVRTNIAALCLLGAWVGSLFILTLYMQQVRGWSALATGLAVFPAAAIIPVLATRLGPPLMVRFGLPTVITAGLLLHALAYVLFLGIGRNSSYVAALLPPFLLVGLGFSFAYAPLTVAATNGVAAEEQGVASGLLNTAFQVGPALVLAVVTAVNDGATGPDGTPESLLDGFHAALVVPVVVALVGAGVSALGIRRRSTVTDVAPSAEDAPAMLCEAVS
jgi:MFS family permease